MNFEVKVFEERGSRATWKEIWKLSARIVHARIKERVWISRGDERGSDWSTSIRSSYSRTLHHNFVPFSLVFPFLRGEKRNDDVVLSSVADALRQLLVCSSSSILVSNGNFNSIRNSFTFRISFRVYRTSENKYVHYLHGQKLTWYVSSFFKDGHILVKLYRASLPTTDTTAEISLAILTIDPLSSELIELLQPSFLRNAFLRFPLNCSREYSTAVVFFEIITNRSRFRRRDNFNEISWYCLLWKHTKTNETENFVEAIEEIFS